MAPGAGERRYKDGLEKRDKVGKALAGIKGREGWSGSGAKERREGDGSRWDRR